MGILYLAVLGSPEVFHDEQHLTFALRKAQALLFYLAVEGGIHSRSKLAALFWPDSEPSRARNALRNAIALLRQLLDTAPSQQSHLFSSQGLLGLDESMPFELDLEVVQCAYQKAQLHAVLPPEEQLATLISQVDHALSLVRGPFLDGFLLGDDTPFDEWIRQQQQQLHIQESLLLDRLSSWYESTGELVQAQAALTRWLDLEPLQEEAYRRLMRVKLAQGDATAAWQIYITCRRWLAEMLQIEPSAETATLARHIRTTRAALPTDPLAHPSQEQRQPPSELVAPLIGRAIAFRQLVASFQQARGGQPQAVFVAGEIGIGKTRLCREFAAWARAQGAEVLCGQAYEQGGYLPYQPVVDALRERLEEENAPEDLLEDLWLCELSRLVPELRIRYPDLPVPALDELTAKSRLFEAVARLLNTLAHAKPLVLLLDDFHWMDEASLDLLRYLARYWIRHSNSLLLLSTVSSEGWELNVQIETNRTDLECDLPVSWVTLQPLNQVETLQLLGAIVDIHEGNISQPTLSETVSSSEGKRPLVELGDFLFRQTGGRPLYLLELLKLLRERKWLVPQLMSDGAYRLKPTLDIAKAVTRKQFQLDLLSSSMGKMILARLAKLTPAARQLVRASAALGKQATAACLWQITELDTQAGVEALEDAVRSGLLREETTEKNSPITYRFSHDLIRNIVYTGLSSVRRQALHQRVLAVTAQRGNMLSNHSPQMKHKHCFTGRKPTREGD